MIQPQMIVLIKLEFFLSVDEVWIFRVGKRFSYSWGARFSEVRNISHTMFWSLNLLEKLIIHTIISNKFTGVLISEGNQSFKNMLNV